MMISTSTTKPTSVRSASANLSTQDMSMTNGDYSNTDQQFAMRKKSLKRFKTSRNDSFNPTLTTSNINTDMDISQQINKKYLIEQFFLQSHPFSDLTLILQNQKLSVDKSVLSTVSTVFHSYLQDKNIHSLEIEDVSSNDMIELLQFLYPQFQCTINYQNVTTLLILGHRFEIHFLANACRAFIRLYLTKFNYISTDSNEMGLIEFEDGSRLPISAILDSLCIWYREFFHHNDDIVCRALLEKLSQCPMSKFDLSDAFNRLQGQLQSRIFQARAKHLEKSYTSTVSLMK